MTQQPESFTAAQASDPATPAQVLADIAALRPDLRPAVAKNPSAYPGLLEWLGSLGEPPVDAALRERTERADGGAADDAGAGREHGPAADGDTPAAQADGSRADGFGPTQPGGFGPAQPGGYGPGQPGGFGPGQPGGFGPGQPGGFGPGQPGGFGPGQPGAAPYGAPAQPYGQPPVGPGGYTPGYAGTPPKRSGNKALWIVLGVVGGLILLGVIAVVVIINMARNAIDIDPNAGYGDDPALDRLWDACEGGDMEACDDLFRDSPLGSEYEEFGDTCGGRQATGTDVYCVDAFGAEEPVEEEPVAEEPVEEEPAVDGFGSDAALDTLWTACEGEDWVACDQLYYESPFDSAYEEFGATCGGRVETAGGSCADSEGQGGGEPFTYGDDPTLDALWDACEGGDGAACDELFWDAPIGSDYEDFGDSCGRRVESGTQVCAGSI